MKKAAIFDLDGTLINTLPDIAHSMNRSLAACGLPTFAVDAYRYKVGNGVFKLAERAVGERKDQLQKVLALYMKDYAKNCRVDSRVYDGIPELFAGLNARGMRVCVFSNKDQTDVESVLSFYFNDFPFAAIRGRVDGVPLKPAPDGALLIAQALGIAPCECCYVGDTMMDMLCGNAASMETFGVAWGFREKKELEDSGARHIIDTPVEMLSIIDAER